MEKCRYRILVVEDSMVLREIESLQLRKAGFETVACDSGEAALEILAKGSLFDAVLLDIELPGISGLDVLSKIRETKSALQLPVIMATGKIDTETTLIALRLGANDYVNKPINFEIAVSRLKSHLALKDLAIVQEKIKEAESIRALIVTYNHEINSALVVAIALMSRGLDGFDQNRLDRTNDALQRIAVVLQKLRNASEKDLQLEVYVGSTQMLKI